MRVARFVLLDTRCVQRGLQGAGRRHLIAGSVDAGDQSFNLINRIYCF